MPTKIYKYRIYPNQATAERLQWILDRCRELSNAAIQERREAWKYARKSVSYYDQQNDLPAVKELRPEYKEIGSHVLQDVLRRVDKAFIAYFKRCKEGKTPGFPRFKGKNQYDSFCYPDERGWKFIPGEKKHAKLILNKILCINVKMHRLVEGKIKTCTIKREGEYWYALLACEVEGIPQLAYSDEAIGIDLGLKTFATLSNGATIESPRFLRKAEKKLAKAQQSLSRKKRGSHRRKKAIQRVTKAHRKVRNQRNDFLHKESRNLVRCYETIVFEDLAPANMSKRPKAKQDENGKYLPNGARAKAGLNKSIRDAGWGQFVQYCMYKAANAGTLVLLVNPHKTSQICSGCGTVVKKDLSERWHSCKCGTELDRDHNAAINILRLGVSQCQKELLVRTEPTSVMA